MKIKLVFITIIILVCGSFIWKKYQDLPQDTVYIALVGPMTGKSHAIGTAMKQGIELYLEDMKANKNGQELYWPIQ